MDAHLEEQIRAFFDANDLSGAATLSLESYGPELLGWLVTSTGDPDLAEEVFSQGAEDLWAGLEAFRWDCSMRTWLYVLARNALVRLRRSPRERREVLRSQISEVAAAVRTRTRPWIRSEVKDRFRVLRESLDEASRELLILRVDRQMAWEDIARVLGEPGDPGQASARIRKRFSLLKAKLHQEAEREGLLDVEC
ncbi:MAG: sigma-70 family RNA polymerase sigma factor [Deltaproteobacteria bacterium]|nr:MAG: sigma-70 family RNA polymerase sigma factor [Deltaproteobacteria bacterium]